MKSNIVFEVLVCGFYLENFYLGFSLLKIILMWHLSTTIVITYLGSSSFGKFSLKIP